MFYPNGIAEWLKIVCSAVIYNMKHYWARRALIRASRSHGFRTLYVRALKRGY